MGLVVVVDNLVLSFFTKISHKFYRLTGLTNFFLAKLSVCIMTVSLMSNILGFWFPILYYKPSPIIVVMCALLCFTSLLNMYLCDKANDAIFNNNRVNFFGLLNYSPTWRFLWLVLVITSMPIFIDNIFFEHKGVLIFNILNQIFGLAAVSFYYFISVDPPAPGKSKIQEWIKAFSVGFQKLVPIRAKD